MRKAALISIFVICAVPAFADQTQAFNEWLDDEFATYLDFSPMAKTRLGDKSDYDKLDDVSTEALDRRVAWRRDSVARMKEKFDRDELSVQGKLSWDLWVYLLERTEAGLPYRHHDYIFGRYGPQSGLPNSLINYHKVESTSDLDAYLSRLSQVRRQLGQYLDRTKRSVEMGVRAPYFDYDRAISESRRVIDGAPFSDGKPSAIWKDILAKIEGLDLPSAEKQKYTNEFRKVLLESFKPGYEEVIAWLEADRKNVPDEATGASALPNGDDYYAYSLFRNTTLPLTANEVHNLGLKEVARIQAEMDDIREAVEFDGDLNDFFAYMRENDRFYYPSTDEGRERYIADANIYVERVKKKLPEYFGLLPKAGLEVRRVEAFREQAGGAAHYSRGTPDGSRPGVFYMHLVDMSAAPTFRLENLVYHEALPGHHMQISIQQELQDLPRFRSYHGFTAFSEGWGLYAEYLARDMGFYEDHYSNFGRLSGELWRAVRLVVDTGIHAKGWTEQQAVDYALANSPKATSAVKSEIRRYFNNPGQATAYKIGMMKILELRQKAMDELGASFDFREFHDVVLGAGSLPMPILEARVEAWLETK